MMLILFLIFISLITHSLGFVPGQATKKTRISYIGMKSGFAKTVASLGIASTILGGSGPILAAVGEGGLPDGAVAFNKLLKYQKDWKVLTDSVSKRKDEVDEKEKLNIKQFLKGLANEYYDMDLLSKSISDPDKKAKAIEVAKEFRTTIRSCDDALTNGGVDKLIDIYPSSAKYLVDFFDLLNDVPDEL